MQLINLFSHPQRVDPCSLMKLRFQITVNNKTWWRWKLWEQQDHPAKISEGFFHVGFCSAITYTQFGSLYRRWIEKQVFFFLLTLVQDQQKLIGLSTHTLCIQLYLASYHLGLIFFPSDISKLHNAKQISFDAKARWRRMSRPACFSMFRQLDELLLILTTHCWRVKIFLQRLKVWKEKQMQYLGIAIQSTVSNF